MTEKSIKHVAIIMDGNGRWAKTRHRPRVWGHVRGSQKVSEIVEAADDAGLKSLTLYAFSTENWSRPVEEIHFLFRLLKKFLLKEKARLIENRVRFKVMGDISVLPAPTKALVEEVEKDTAHFDGLMLTFAFNYGSRQEIVNAVNRFLVENPDRLISEKDISENLFMPETQDVDLIIRTSGEKRVSNFLLWQLAYAEFFFTPTLWPDFSGEEFLEILDHVSQRERRFGSLSANANYQKVSSKALQNKGATARGVH